MTGTIKVFACPKCGLIIDHGKNPCPYCKTAIAWEGMSPDPQAGQQMNQQPSQQMTQQVQQTTGYQTPIVDVNYTAQSVAPESNVSQSTQNFGQQASAQLMTASGAPTFNPVDNNMQFANQNQSGQSGYANMPSGTAQSYVSPQNYGAAQNFGKAQGYDLDQGYASAQNLNIVQNSTQSQLQNTGTAQNATQVQGGLGVNDLSSVAMTSATVAAPTMAAAFTAQPPQNQQDMQSQQGQQMQSQQGQQVQQCQNYGVPYLAETQPGNVLPRPEYHNYGVPYLPDNNSGEANLGAQSGAQISGVQNTGTVVMPNASGAPAPTAEASYAAANTTAVGTVQGATAYPYRDDSAAIAGAGVGAAVGGVVGAVAQAPTTEADTTANAAATATGTGNAVATAANSTVAADTSSTGTSNTTSQKSAPPLPDLPPIKQSGSYSGKKRKRSVGITAVSVIMKIFAVIAWIIAIVFLVGGAGAFVSVFDPFSFENLIVVLTSDPRVTQAITFIIVGFFFFAVGVIIGLLGDIRRGVR